MNNITLDENYLNREKAYNEIIPKIPTIKFKGEWDVKIIPPFCMADARFIVYKGDKSVSIYLDMFDNLGCFGEPYWEIYPNAEGTNERFAIEETKDLEKAICDVLDNQ